MPKIYLKPQSAEFADDESATRSHAKGCDMPGCPAEGEYKAPRDRELSGYFFFCLEHVSEYNKAWNYFSGMSHSEVEDHIVRSATWDRPTWRFHSYADLKEKLYQKAWQTYNFTDKEAPKSDHAEDRYRKSQISRHSPEYEAMAIMGLEPPLDLSVIKTKYKELVKKYHPDINRDNPEAENILKSVNMAYTILKLAFEKYEELKVRDNA